MEPSKKDHYNKELTQINNNIKKWCKLLHQFYIWAVIVIPYFKKCLKPQRVTAEYIVLFDKFYDGLQEMFFKN